MANNPEQVVQEMMVKANIIQRAAEQLYDTMPVDEGEIITPHDVLIKVSQQVGAIMMLQTVERLGEVEEKLGDESRPGEYLAQTRTISMDNNEFEISQTFERPEGQDHHDTYSLTLGANSPQLKLLEHTLFNSDTPFGGLLIARVSTRNEARSQAVLDRSVSYFDAIHHHVMNNIVKR